MDTHEPWRYKGRKMVVKAGGRRRATAQPVSTDMPFSTLLYRYFLFGWLFKDVNRGNVLERAAAWRHNREQARWLPTYMRRWMWVAIVFYALGQAVESLLQAPGASVVFYLPSALAVPVNAVICAAWIGLRVRPAQA